MMEHREIHDSDLIDKYLLNQLADTEENELEEHLLFCEECQNLLEKRKTTIGLINDHFSKTTDSPEFKTKKNEKSRIYKIRFLKIAASLTILLSTGWLLNNLFSSHSGKKISDYKPISDTIFFNKKSKFDLNNKQLADNSYINKKNYLELPAMENFIKNSMRSTNISVLMPKVGQKYSVNEAFKIEWGLEKTDSLNFVVFNNKGKLLFEKTITKSFEYKHELKNGLFYWQLETEEEAIFTGKFFIK